MAIETYYSLSPDRRTASLGSAAALHTSLRTTLGARAGRKDPQQIVRIFIPGVAQQLRNNGAITSLHQWIVCGLTMSSSRVGRVSRSGTHSSSRRQLPSSQSRAGVSPADSLEATSGGNPSSTTPASGAVTPGAPGSAAAAAADGGTTGTTPGVTAASSPEPDVWTIDDGPASSFHQLVQTAKTLVVARMFQQLEAAEAARDVEYRASVRIQTRWRGYAVRLCNARRTDAARNVQRIWRGFAGRRRFAAVLQEAEDEAMMRFFDQCATSVQRVWRGYRSRHCEHDFYARKAYLQTIQCVNNERRQATIQEAVQTERDVMDQVDAETSKAFDQAMEKLHYLRSTKAQAGVLNPPYEKPTVFDVPIEVHLQQATSRIAQKRRRFRRTNPPPHVLDAGPTRKQGPFLPASLLAWRAAQPAKVTLRMDDPYDWQRVVQGQERRFERTQRIGSSHFHFTARSGSSMREHAYMTSVFRGNGYTPADPSPFRKADPTKRVSHRPFVVGAKALDPDSVHDRLV